MNRRVGFALAVGFCALSQIAVGQDRVYRCEGRSYSQHPCANGTAIEVTDARSAPQVTQARQAAQVDARLADALARQRQHAEWTAARQGPVLIGGPARVAHDPTPCRMGSTCSRTERSKRSKHERNDRVTLYRAPVTQ